MMRSWLASQSHDHLMSHKVPLRLLVMLRRTALGSIESFGVGRWTMVTCKESIRCGLSRASKHDGSDGCAQVPVNFSCLLEHAPTWACVSFVDGSSFILTNDPPHCLLPINSTEHDLIGDEYVPISAYYGIQTQRAMKNFDITGVPISHFPVIIQSLAMVKKAAALANFDLGHLDKVKKDAIVAACDELIQDDALYDQFPVDLIQGGAGTSTNMNANEVKFGRPVLARLCLYTFSHPIYLSFTGHCE